MTEQLEPAIVRICTATRNYVGVGVLVSVKHVLTCAHVVADALRRSRTQQDQPAETVYLDFPFIAPGQLLSAKVVFWRAVLPDQSVLPEMGEDIAGLELNELPPLAASPILLHQSVQASELEGHQFEVFGIPAGNPQGSWADGIVLKRLANGWIQIEDREQGGFQIEAGFSGSPVWDKQLKAVIGITVATDPKRPQAKVGFMIPTQRLFKAWEELPRIKYVEYWEAFSNAFPPEFPLELSESARSELTEKHQKLRLSSEEVRSIENFISVERIAEYSDVILSYEYFDRREYIKQKSLPDNVRFSLESYEYHKHYNHLASLLKENRWEEADELTFSMLYEFVNTPSSVGEFSGFVGKLTRFPAKDLNTIDYLWKKYSNGLFGFSVQKEIFMSFEPDETNSQAGEDEVILQRFLETVRWVDIPSKPNLFTGANLVFNLNVPSGHLPAKALTWGIIRTGSKLDYKKHIELMGNHIRGLFSKLNSVSQEV